MFVANIKKIAEENTNFRKVLYTGVHSQIVLMSIPVGEDIGQEVHAETDQILYIVEGEGETILNGQSRTIEEHDSIFVPAGTTHNFINTGDEALKLFTIYAPPEHLDGTVHKTKKDAGESEEYV